MNTSGIQPINCNVLVLPDTTEEKTAGGLIKPESVLERDQHAQTTGTVVALAPDAFLNEYGNQVVDVRPGAQIMFARYSGKKITGDDDRVMVKDVDITGILS